MGTNYYVEVKEPCHCCGKGKVTNQVHIGKSSAGWCFALHVIPERDINSLEDWKKYLKGKKIVDEYGKRVPHVELLSIITERSWKNIKTNPFGYDSWEDFHYRNHSEPGPNYLVRAKVDGIHCVGHGEGTWDLIAGEFS